jgi:hypothetical protein
MLDAVTLPRVGITIGPDAPDPVDPVTSKFENGLFGGHYKIDDEDGDPWM